MSRNTLERQSQTFNEKKVIKLQCKYCDNCLSARGMKANLLADTTVELFSTDSPMIGNISPVGAAYKAETCQCRISNIACLVCGNIVGYHVTRPCRTCLSSCNNGHFWMFFSESSYPSERVNKNGSSIMRWSNFQTSDDEDFFSDECFEEEYEECLR